MHRIRSAYTNARNDFRNFFPPRGEKYSYKIGRKYFSKTPVGSSEKKKRRNFHKSTGLVLLGLKKKYEYCRGGGSSTKSKNSERSKVFGVKVFLSSTPAAKITTKEATIQTPRRRGPSFGVYVYMQGLKPRRLLRQSSKRKTHQCTAHLRPQKVCNFGDVNKGEVAL